MYPCNQSALIDDNGNQNYKRSIQIGSDDVENPDDVHEAIIFVDIPTAPSRWRGRAPVLFAILGTGISFAVGLDWYAVPFVDCGSMHILLLSVALISSMYLGELSCRLFLLLDEIRNRNTRHNGHLSLAVSRTMDLNIWLLLVLIVSPAIMLSICSWKSLLYLLAIPVQVCIHLCWDGFAFEVLSISREEPYWTIGRTFALQYYYGYLDKVLPSLSKRIEMYEKVQFKGRNGLAAKRLILLAPTSCYTRPKFNQDLIDLFESKNVEQVIDNCCGTEGRIYKNPIYVIWNGDEWFCFAMEGIAMLNNLYAMKTRREMTNDQLCEEYSNFCNGLSDVLNNSEYANCVELISYDDSKNVDIADIVLQRFKTFQSHLI